MGNNGVGIKPNTQEPWKTVTVPNLGHTSTEAGMGTMLRFTKALTLLRRRETTEGREQKIQFLATREAKPE